MTKRFKVYKDEAGEYRWRLLAGNARIVATSGEGYHNKQDCLDAIEIVRSTQDRVETELEIEDEIL